MNLTLNCLHCGAERNLDFSIENFKKYIMTGDNYICLKCIADLHLN